jgi:2-dehydro-3-deoxygluconokinase
MHPTTPAPCFDITTFGEMLVRISVRAGKRLENASQYDVYPAGAEANVLTLLSRLERKTCWVGALPNNPLGRLAFNALQGAGVDTQGALWKDSGRMGTYREPCVGRTGLETGARAPDAHP